MLARGFGEELPKEIDELRNEDDRILDCTEMEGCLRRASHTVSAFTFPGSASGPGDVGASGMGSVADSSTFSSGSSAFSFSAFSVVSAAWSLSSLGGSSAGVVSPAVSAAALFLLDFFFCFCSCAT